MFFYHFLPQPILIKIGPINIYWYGILAFLAFWLGFFLVLRLIKYTNFPREKIIDLMFWLFVFSLIGARLFHVFSNFYYYREQPVEILFFWQGGLGIFGAMIIGMIFLYFYSRKYHLDFWRLLDLFSPSLALSIVIIRWGNYFNQELYGLPTDSFFRIPISPENRLPGFENFNFFQPVFFYESIFCFFVFVFLILRFKKSHPGSIFSYFLIFYSTFRFLIEFLRIDPQPIIFGLRLGQIMSLLGLIFYFLLLTKKFRARRDLNPRSPA